jgi:CheY-like chemotaxis protein
LILLDWNMPNMDGITLVGRIRATDKRTPLVMCTAEAEKGRVLEALKAGKVELESVDIVHVIARRWCAKRT